MKKFSLSVGKNKNKVKSFVSSKTKYKLPFDKFSKNKPKKDNKPDPNKPKLFVFKPKKEILMIIDIKQDCLLKI